MGSNNCKHNQSHNNEVSKHKIVEHNTTGYRFMRVKNSYYTRGPECVVKLTIPKGALTLCDSYDDCRTNMAYVTRITCVGSYGSYPFSDNDKLTGIHYNGVDYRENTYVHPDEYDLSNEMVTHGIHYCKTQERVVDIISMLGIHSRYFNETKKDWL